MKPEITEKAALDKPEVIIKTKKLEDSLKNLGTQWDKLKYFQGMTHNLSLIIRLSTFFWKLAYIQQGNLLFQKIIFFLMLNSAASDEKWKNPVFVLIR